MNAIQQMEGKRVYRSLTRGQLQQLATERGGAYRFAELFSERIEDAWTESLRTTLREVGIHTVGLEFAAPATPSTFPEVDGSIGLSVIWLTAGHSSVTEPHIHAFAVVSEGSLSAVHPSTTVVPGTLFVGHYRGGEETITSGALIEALQSVNVGETASPHGLLAGEFCALPFAQSGLLLHVPETWYGFAARLTVRSEGPGRVVVAYDNVRYRHFEWLLRVLELRSFLPASEASTAVPNHSYTVMPPYQRGLPQWAPGAGSTASAGAFELRYAVDSGTPQSEETVQQLRTLADAGLAEQRRRADSLLDDGDVKDYRYWFARVYQYVTEGELAFIDSGTYHYPEYVLASIVYFEQIYKDNFEAYSQGRPVESHWQQAFDEAGRRHARVKALEEQLLSPPTFGSSPEATGGIAMALIVEAVLGSVVSLVESMKAHIRFDLPRAEAWVFNSRYSHNADASISDFQADFMAMTGVFDNAGRRMNEEMADKLSIPVNLLPQLLQDTSMRYFFDADMVTERADTWRRAEQLVSSGNAGNGPYQLAAQGITGDVTTGDNLSGITSLPTESYRPTMESSAPIRDDNEVREFLESSTDAEVAALPAIVRVRMLRGLHRGSTTNDDEQAILRILRASVNKDVAILIDGADAWDLLYACDGDEAYELRALFRQHYYSRTTHNMALRLLRKCIEGETAEWEEEMIIDILELQPDSRGLIEQIGHIYQSNGPATEADADFKNGLYKLEWQLDGAEQTKLTNLFGASGH